MRRERVLVGVLCALAALRVLVLSAGFPLFNNVDEYHHFDYVWKCAHGELPGPMQKLSPRVATVIALYCWMPDYQSSKETIRFGQVLPPVWTLPKDVRDIAFPIWQARFASQKNHESVQPPVYYLAAGLWYRFGALLHIPDRLLPFWVRLLNVPMVAILVWVSYRLAKLLFPRNTFLRLGTPLMISVLPQDVFYSISNGTLGAVLFTVALYALALVYLNENGRYGLHAAAGLAVGATVTTMYTSSPILLVVGAVALACILRARKTGTLRAALRKLLVLCAAAALLPAIWCVRNYYVFGEVTAMPAFVRYANWKPLPFAEMWDHPVFTAEGALCFWSDTLASYFRGEFVWHGKQMAYPWLDAFYVWSSPVFLLIAFGSFLRRGKPARFAGLMSAALFATSVAMLIGASMRYDFGSWFWPSRDYPYYSAGRLILHTIVPFVFLYLTGLEVMLETTRLGWLKFPVLIAVCGLMLGSEIALSLPVFAAKCNFFHLLRLRA